MMEKNKETPNLQSNSTVPTCATARQAEVFRSALRHARYDEIHVARRLKISNIRKTADLLLQVRRFNPTDTKATENADTLGILIWLFLLNRSIPLRIFHRAFHRDLHESLKAMNLVQVEDDSIRSSLLIFPIREFFVITDGFGNYPVENKVMPLLAESYDLATLTTRRSLFRALDLCTGSGVHAFLASKHCEELVAVDNNPRAIAFSKFSAWLNGISNVEFRCGDLYEALQDSEQFDLIIANPPYCPEVGAPAGTNFSSGGESGEEILGRIISGLPDFSSAKSYCQIITLIIHREEDELRERIRNWLGARHSQFDVFVLANVLNYGPEVFSESNQMSLADRQLHESWKKQKISGFSFGIINFRRIQQNTPPLFLWERFPA